MFAPLKFKSAISRAINFTQNKSLSRSQLVKNFLLNGWVYESAESLADTFIQLRDMEELYLERLFNEPCDMAYSELCRFYLDKRRSCNYGKVHNRYCPYCRC